MFSQGMPPPAQCFYTPLFWLLNNSLNSIIGLTVEKISPNNSQIHRFYHKLLRIKPLRYLLCSAKIAGHTSRAAGKLSVTEEGCELLLYIRHFLILLLRLLISYLFIGRPNYI